MKTSLKKKLAVAILTGCSSVILSGIALANPPQSPPIPQVEITNEALHASPSKPLSLNVDFQNYCNQFEDDYSWMYLSTRERLARDYLLIDKALKNNKISSMQADKLKQEIIDFYKDNQKYQDNARKLTRKEAKIYRHEHAKHFFLNDNFDEISQDTTIPVATLKNIFKHPEPRRIHQEKPYRGELNQRLVEFTNQLIAEGKITQEEVDVLGNYMQAGRDKFAKMDKQERHDYLDTYKQKTDEQRLVEISQGTGISNERLQEIFVIFKQAVKDKLQAQTQD